MDSFWKTVALVLVAVILWLVVEKREKDISVLLTLAVCCAAAAAAASYLEPVLALLWQLENMGQLEDGLLKLLLKAVGIGFVAETAGMICTDAGNGSMGNMVRFLGSAAILFVSIPILNALMNLIQEILGII